MTERREESGPGGLAGVLDQLPTERLLKQSRDFASALGERAATVAVDKVGDVTDRLLDYVENGARAHDGDGDGGHRKPLRMLLAAGAAGLKETVTSKFTGGGGRGGGKGGKLKVTNISEEIEVGVPVRVAYNQWTQFQDFPQFTKRVEKAEQESDEKIAWKAGIFLSHRVWESTIVEQVPDELIVWRSKGDKGHVDGAVTFHELAPNLTKILLVLEYHPQGLFERTGNLWRAQGRRVRLELKHYRRHVMTRTILDPDGVEGWRGEIRDGEVVRSHEDAMDEESQDDADERHDDEDRDDEDRDDYDDEDEDAYDDEEEGEYDEDEDEDEDHDFEHDEDDEDDEQDEARPRRRTAAGSR